MKKIISIILAFALLLGMTACATTHRDWQEQYDLGMRYLEDGDYEQAVLAFSAAIEIDPNNPEAYMGRAEAYRGLGDLDKALKDYKRAKREAKNNDDFEDLLDELEELIEEIEELIDNPPTEPPRPPAEIPQLTRAEVYTDGVLAYSDDMRYDENGLLVEVIHASYNAAGNAVSEYISRYGYNEAGQLVQAYYGDTGEATYTYDAEGRLVESTYFDARGSLTEYTYDDNGKLLYTTTSEEYTTTTDTYVYNEQGLVAEIQRNQSHEYGQSEYTTFYIYDETGVLTGKTEVGAIGTHYTAYTYCPGVTVEMLTFDYTPETDLVFRITAKGGQSLWSTGVLEGTYTVDEQGRVVSATGIEQTMDGVLPRELRFYYGETADAPAEMPPEEPTEVPAVDNRDWITDLNHLLSGVAYPPAGSNVSQWSDAAVARAIYSKINSDYFASDAENYLKKMGLDGDYYEDGYTAFSLESVHKLTKAAFGRPFPEDTDTESIRVSDGKVLLSFAAGESHFIHVQSYEIQGDRITAVGIAVYSNPSETAVQGYFKAVAKVNPNSAFGCTLLSFEMLEGNQSFGNLTARASSVLEGSNAYKAANVLDGRPDTAWVEGVNGVGKNEWILLETTDGSDMELFALGILVGYHKSEDLLLKNGHPTQVLVECADGYRQTVNFYSFTDLIVFDRSVTTSWVRITILDAQAGSKYTDTCISEIIPYGIRSGSGGQETARNPYDLYKNYFYANFSSQDEVYLADVTHDGEEEMIVVNFSDEIHSVV
jgi:YD repeat-containing protein